MTLIMILIEDHRLFVKTVAFVVSYKGLKNLPLMPETWVQSLGWEDPLEKGMITHSSFLTWRILWTEEPGRLQSMRPQRVRCDWATNISFRWHSGEESAYQCRRRRRGEFNPWLGRSPGEGNSNPLQYSCLENPMDREACPATVHGVAKSWTWLSERAFVFRKACYKPEEAGLSTFHMLTGQNRAPDEHPYRSHTFTHKLPTQIF